jgi:hypothetical protein
MMTGPCYDWKDRLPRALLAFLLGMPLLAMPGYCVAAPGPEVEGLGQIRFAGAAPDAQARQKALQEAKQDAIENYVVYLRAKGAFPADRYRAYLDHKSRMDASPDQYFVSVTVVEEAADSAAGQYRVRIRATINGVLFDRDTVLVSSVRK